MCDHHMKQDIKKIDEKLDQFREDMEKTIKLISEKQPEEDCRAVELKKISEKVRDDIKQDMNVFGQQLNVLVEKMSKQEGQ